MAAALNCIKFHIDFCRCPIERSMAAAGWQLQNGHQQAIGYFQTAFQGSWQRYLCLCVCLYVRQQLSIRLRVR